MQSRNLTAECVDTLAAYTRERDHESLFDAINQHQDGAAIFAMLRPFVAFPDKQTAALRALVIAAEESGWDIGPNAGVLQAGRDALAEVGAELGAWGVWCRVSGGVTGHRESWLKSNGEIQRFETEAEAKAEALRCYDRLSPHRTAVFNYSPRAFT